MIRPLRQRHRVIVCTLGVLLPVAFATGLLARKTVPVAATVPLELVRQRNGPAPHLLLVSRDGKPANKQVLNLVAEPVEITGEVERQGELLILKADPATYHRVSK